MKSDKKRGLGGVRGEEITRKVRLSSGFSAPAPHHGDGKVSFPPGEGKGPVTWRYYSPV